MKKGAALDESVVNDGVTFFNNTKDQRAAWKADVDTFVREKEAINKEFENAWNYEMDNIDVDNSDGELEIEVENKK